MWIIKKNKTRTVVFKKERKSIGSHLFNLRSNFLDFRIFFEIFKIVLLVFPYISILRAGTENSVDGIRCKLSRFFIGLQSKSSFLELGIFQIHALQFSQSFIFKNFINYKWEA